MGKIRIKHIGFGQLEKAEKKKAKNRLQQKKKKKKTARVPGLKGGERVVAVGPSPEELEKEVKKKVEPRRGSTSELSELPKTPKFPKQRSLRYQKLAKLVDKNKLYSPSEAFQLLKKMTNTNFKGSVEAHINLKQIIKQREYKATGDARRGAPGKGPQLVSWRNGPGAAKRQDPSPSSVHFEKKFPLAHAVLGKTSEPTSQLEKNLEKLIKKLNPDNIKKLTLSSSMSPGLKVAFSPNYSELKTK